jgi:uncharacterized delta-60 repeat protein
MRHLVIILPLAVCVLLAMSGSLLLAQSGMDERQQNTEQVGQGYTPERYLSPRLRHLGQERYDVHDLLDPFFDRFPHDPSRWESNQVRLYGEERTNEIPSRRDGLPSLRDRGPQTPNHGAVTNAAGGAASQSLPDSVQEAWVRHYGSLAPSNDWVSAMVIDGFGNVYVTGWGKGSGTSNDYATVKYNSSGTELWVARYNGPGNGDDWATALAVDESGNVYVTGESDGSGTSRDYATVKYNSSGTELWVARYNGPGNGDDRATALAVDASGNVYVTGGSYGSGTSYDYATVKYNSSGTELWVARYNDPENEYDIASALAVDEPGNVYVTGRSERSGTSYDYDTVKYNSSGTELWVARYNGTGNGIDRTTALAVDASGNVYVTGTSYGSGTSYDYATVKYNSSGTELWVARYNGPGNIIDRANALAVDESGNVYVTGGSYGSGTSRDYATVKYNSSGTELWVARYNGPENGDDYATALAVDASGNVYVTGWRDGSGTYSDFATVKYNSSGTELWVARYNGSGNGDDRATALAVDASGNVYVTGTSYGSGTSYDYATVKYNSSGTELWVARYNGPGNIIDRANALAVDESGNVYVTGGSDGSGTSYDYATVKYNSSGTELWVARYNGPGNGDDYATALAVDASGNVYVTGWSDGSGTYSDFATVKYNSSGTELWVARYNGPGNGDDRATALAVDASGNVYVTGESESSGTYSDYATVKYNSSGTELWVSRYNGPENGDDYATALAVDASGNVYVTGWSDGSGTYRDYATVKYNSSGTELWVARYNGPGNSDDYATALAIDASGNVYVTGESVGSGTSRDYATVKYNSSGTELWVARYNGPGNSHDSATALAVDESGNVYVTGESVGSGTSRDYATVKYNSSGTELWVARYNGPGNSDDYATALAIDASGNVYVTGGSEGSGTYSDFATVKYNSSGTEQWVARYNGPGNKYDRATALAVDESGNVYVTGYYLSGDWGKYTTIKYTQITTSIGEIGTNVPDKFALEQNYPNPFNPTTTIRFSIPQSSYVTLKIYDLLGQEIETLVNENLPAGQYKSEWNAAGYSSGVYFYRLLAGPVSGGQADGFAEVRKLILLK